MLSVVGRIKFTCVVIPSNNILTRPVVCGHLSFRHLLGILTENIHVITEIELAWFHFLFQMCERELFYGHLFRRCALR